MNESPDLDAMRQNELVASASPHEDRVAKDQNPSRAIPLPPLSALKENDPDAWNELVRKLFPAALAAAKTKLRGDYAEDARDIALGAVNSLVYKVATVESTDELPHLLLAIMYKEAASFMRAALAEKRGGGELVHFGVLEDWFEDDGNSPDMGSIPCEEAHIHDLADIIRRLAKSLSPKFAKLLKDRFFSGKSYKEMAAGN